MSFKIVSVADGSPAARAGIKPGDTLLSVGGEEIHDVLDYQFLTTERKLVVGLTRGEIRIKKDEYEDLGLGFESYLMDTEKHCKNNCVFCFISQLPKGMRKPLYFKDDDARLSFLQGNYVTLTNLSDEDIDRIIKMRLNVNVSVHTTNPALRVEMTKNPHAGEALKHFYRLAQAGNHLNCQLVLCPGINDGAELEKTLSDLVKLYPSVTSIACVPVGLTKYREGLPELQSFDKEGAAGVIDTIERFGDAMYKEHGDRLIYPADEFFLLAERDIPEYEYYGDFEQYENGVGMWSSLRKEFLDALEYAPEKNEIVAAKRTIATGVLATPLISSLAQRAMERFPNVEINVITIRNDFFGEKITVTGLTTGNDLITQLLPLRESLGDELLISVSMLRSERDVFLDDVTPEMVEEKLGLPLRTVENDGGALLDAMLGITCDNAT